MKKLLLTGLGTILALVTFAQSQHLVTGKIISAEDGNGLPGVLIRAADSPNGTVTDENGDFEFYLPQGAQQLDFSLMGYLPMKYKVDVPRAEPLTVSLSPNEFVLRDVEIVSTGYTVLPKERATGSFVQIDQELVDRRVSPNILERLEDVTPGLIFNRDNISSSDPISIRGRSTLFGNSEPLIVIDNFPYDGPVENINPNDVASITILKDAAAASIWGAKAGNGVIVITTHHGALNKGPSVSLNSNVTVMEKPDLFYRPIMGPENFIETERLLFEAGRYAQMENAVSRTALSPVVESLIGYRDGNITVEELDSRLNAFRTTDVRRQLSHYYYRPQINQQYAINVKGGGLNNQYVFSAGLDENRGHIVGSRSGRKTLNAKSDWSFLNQKLSISAGIYYAENTGEDKTQLPSPYIYESLADRQGNALPIVDTYSVRYLDEVQGSGLLDWRYVPLNEINIMDNRSKTYDARFNTSLSYKLTDALQVETLYQYWAGNDMSWNNRPEQSYFARDFVNRFTQILPNGTLSRAIPHGGIVDVQNQISQSHNGRVQLRYSRTINKDHQVNGLAGYELKSLTREGNSVRYYGYEDEIGLSKPVDFTTNYRLFHSQGLASIPRGTVHTGIIDRFVSYYLNGAYTYANKYTLSLSARKDMSNLFGVETNQRGVPLWSAGASWIMSEEGFYKFSAIPYLKFRTTYGFNGNVDRTVSALTTANYIIGGPTALIPNLPYAIVTNPPNPNLRWERIRVVNLALDFEAGKRGWLSGSMEYYLKDGLDLIGDQPFHPSSGVSTFRGNFADTRTKGVDLALNSRNIDGKIRWETNFFLSYINEKVTGYELDAPSILNYLTPGFIFPLENRPLFSIFSIPSAGLNPDTGDPMGYVDGEPSSNYTVLLNSLTVNDLHYHGPARPVYFGSVRNDFSYNNFSLSINLSYRGGYYYRNETVNYSVLMNGVNSHPDFLKRWQQPGDEMRTTVPSLPQTINSNRESMTRLAPHLVEKGDHIRIQDIRLSYNLNRSGFADLPFGNIELYTYANNVGMLWKASNDPLDPDFRTMRPLRSIAAGIRIDF